jgi:hypothetical protein
MHLIRRFGGETYGSGQVGAGAAAAAALRNRNIAAATNLVAPYTPSGLVIAAIAFTPRVSGVLQISAILVIVNGVNAEQYTLAMTISPGTGLTVTGGAATSDGWVMGSTVPPVIGGVTGATQLALQDIGPSIGNGIFSTLSVFGISPAPALPLGVPAVVQVLLGQAGGGHALAQLAFVNLTVLELP